MQLKNLTRSVIEIKNINGYLFKIKPDLDYIDNYKIKIIPKFRDFNSRIARKRIKQDGFEEVTIIKDCNLTITNLPPSQENVLYIVTPKLQMIIRTFTDRTDFYCVIKNRLCNVKPKRKSYNNKQKKHKNGNN